MKVTWVFLQDFHDLLLQCNSVLMSVPNKLAGGCWCSWLQVLSWLVLRLCGCEVVFKEALQVLEGRSLLWLFPPAGQHQLVHRLGALGRARHPVATLHLVEHLPVHHSYNSKGRKSQNVHQCHLFFREGEEVDASNVPHLDRALCLWWQVQLAGSQRTRHQI